MSRTWLPPPKLPLWTKIKGCPVPFDSSCTLDTVFKWEGEQRLFDSSGQPPQWCECQQQQLSIRLFSDSKRWCLRCLRCLPRIPSGHLSREMFWTCLTKRMPKADRPRLHKRYFTLPRGWWECFTVFSVEQEVVWGYLQDFTQATWSQISG